MDWKILNEAWNLGIPTADIEQFEPVLNGLYEALEPVFRQDLSVVEPVGSFRPDGR